LSRDRDELSSVDLAKPPRGLKSSHSLISGIDVVWHRVNPAVLFLIPFTALWSGLSLWGIYGSQYTTGTFDPAASLAGLPFVAGTVVLAAVILHMLFGSWRLHIDRGRARIFSGIGPFGRSLEIPLGPRAVVEVVRSRWRTRGRLKREIRVENDGHAVHFGASLPEDVMLFFAAVLDKAARTG
jgi:hypothetical protein